MSLRLRSFLVLSLLAVVFGLALSPRLDAQTAAGATVRGNVLDPDDALIPGAVVTLTPASGKALTAKSQSHGTYTFRGVPAGTYSITVTATGFATYAKLAVKVAPGVTLTSDVKMALQEQSQVVQVTAQSAQVSVDPDNNSSMTVIKGKDLDALSDDPDELSSELSALAGPAAGPNGGQIYVDGFTGGQLPPKSSIREIRINQNPFSAQYDKIGFGRVEVFTKPGTDKYHGSMSLQGNDSSFNSTNPFEGKPLPYHSIFFLGQISGPINKKASFTVGGSHRTIQDNEIINPTSFFANSTTSTTLCAPRDFTCSNVGGFPAGSHAVFYPQERYDFTPRIDLALSDKNTLTARFQYETGNAQNAGISTLSLPGQGSNTENSERTLQISDSQVFSAKVVNETRFEFLHTNSASNPLSTAATLAVQGNFTGGGSGGFGNASTGDHIEAQNYTSIALSKNFIRFGGRLRYNSESLTSRGGTSGSFTYSTLIDPCSATSNLPSGCISTAGLAPSATTCNTNLTANSGTYYSSYQCGLPYQYNITKINTPTISGSTTDIGLYAEDDWKPRANLSISYGLRFEAQTKINSSHDFAPRTSISYGIPRKNGATTTVLRGGFGFFYDRFALGNVLSTYQNNGTNTITSIYLNPGLGCQPSNPTGCTTGVGVTPKVDIETLAPNLRASYNMQGALGVDQQVNRSIKFSVNYLMTRGVHQFFSAAIPTATNYIYQFGSGGVFNQKQLSANFSIAMKRVSLNGFYVLSFAHSDTGGAGSFLTHPTNPGLDYGRATFNQKNFAVIQGTTTLPFKISASPFIIMRSGNPYNITTGTDVNGDSISNDRPAFNPNVPTSCTNAASFITPTAAQAATYTPIPINFCTAPAIYTFNVRVSRTFGFGPKTGVASGPDGGGRQGGFQPGMGGGPGGGGGGGGRGGGGGGGGQGGGPGGRAASSGRKYSLTFGVQGNNIFNIVALGTPVGTLTSPKFGQSITTGGLFGGGTAPRLFRLQATLNF